MKGLEEHSICSSNPKDHPSSCKENLLDRPSNVHLVLRSAIPLNKIQGIRRILQPYPWMLCHGRLPQCPDIEAVR